MTLSTTQLAEQFQPGQLDPLLRRLEVTDRDRAELLAAVADLTEADLRDVANAEHALAGHIGQWAYAKDEVFARWPDQPGRPRGFIPMLALLAAVPRVLQYQGERGIAEDQTYTALSDLGRKLVVFRATFGEFGIDTQQWMTTVWSGAFCWLGRLQFNLIPYEQACAISTHIPEGGSLGPDAVDDSFARARTFFGTHFADAPVRYWHCSSWLLNPRLPQVLDARSNIAQFQQRWRLTGDRSEDDAGIVYFVFHRRPRPGEQLDLTGLPRRSSLERAVMEHLDAGGHWYSHTGVIDY